MPLVTQQAPPGLDTEGLRKHTEEQYREIERAWVENEDAIIALSDSLSALDASVVKHTAQTLTVGQKEQARENIYAAPFDAIGYHGLQINGAFDVFQGLSLATLYAVGAGAWIADQWRVSKSGAGATGYCVVQNATGIGGCGRMLQLHSNPGWSSVAAGDYFGIIQPIEGHRWRALAWDAGVGVMRPLTIAFWAFSQVAGTFGLTVRDPTGSASYCVGIDVAASTWEFKTVTVPPPSVGTWTAHDSALGALITITWVCGSTYQGVTGAWQSGNFLGVVGQTNMHPGAGSNTYVLGFGMFPGSDAPEGNNMGSVLQPADKELVLCQRHYEFGLAPLHYRSAPSGVTAGYDSIYFKTTKRASPTITFDGAWQYFSGGTGTAVTPVFNSSSIDRFSWTATGLTNFNGWTSAGTWFASSRLI